MQPDRYSYLTSLACSACGRTFDADAVRGTCPDCGLVLFATYDLDAVRRDMPQPRFDGRSWDLWRYHELLPVRDPANVHSLGEGATPLLDVPNAMADAVGLTAGELLIKDEGRNPTGSFKARGMAVAMARAAELGIREVALPSAGNAGAAAAAYAAAAGIGCHVAMPNDVPNINRLEAEAYGAEVTLVDGLIDFAGRLVRERAATEGWFDLSTLREPYRAEGKKTMAYELAEAGGWGDAWCPDVLVFPTGGGTGIVGMWKAFAELGELGWIGSRRPRMVVVQAQGCAPLVRAFEQGADRAEPWVDAHTIAAGMRVPSGIGDYLVLRALRESGGSAVSVTDEEILDAQKLLAEKAGIYAAPEGAATVAALPHLAKAGFTSPTDRVVLFNTAMGMKADAVASAAAKLEALHASVVHEFPTGSIDDMNDDIARSPA